MYVLHYQSLRKYKSRLWKKTPFPYKSGDNNNDNSNNWTVTSIKENVEKMKYASLWE